MSGPFDFRNNVVFNWRHRSIDGGDETSEINLINNYFKPGPATNENMRAVFARIEQRSMYFPVVHGKKVTGILKRLIVRANGMLPAILCIITKR